jgi:hypothetical protein
MMHLEAIIDANEKAMQRADENYKRRKAEARARRILLERQKRRKAEAHEVRHGL